ncbi:MAG: acetate/propionate family kinase [Burkholderia contaminans]|jgi:acetate kinase|uniref:Acetate kinase n=1 Tax=Burkholderia contaminans TaxID=488447 RepID=A0AAP4R214_9BURK|nr:MULTISPECIES: acetate/propionate family kinase [Burkholderia]MBD1413744.1 acetate/propionate family kinase [Burkholderia contaminans]MBH9669321.1 acetate/propionate family kinase [Burkholderia contaminans]MBH9676305.1 acetate/propionate family kinase [Burkholderia contaminans]MBH9706729.1 acetate/propionate family kinase [Burkholderia contaminans]MBM6425853.1 acetate/propionate family kinase [Burkholderia contaminans]
MRTLALLVVNAGSSSVKFAVFAYPPHGDPARRPLHEGEAVETGNGVSLRFDAAPGGTLPLRTGDPYRAVLAQVAMWIRVQLPHIALGAIAHRVVHGGARYVDPVVVDDAVLDALRTLTPLAPLHQPHSLDAIDALRDAFPDVPQVAVFDTAFHRTLPRAEQLLPLPHAWFDQGVRRYGFHGLSYEYLAAALDERFGARAHGRVIAAHLGSGASLCAMRDCRSVATTMGFSALDGLMMSTRCGTLDPGVVLHLLEAGKLSTAALGHMLYHESGLKGVSGASGDPRVLLACEAAGDAFARDALTLYVHRIVREAGALVALLGGLDMLVFTAGIGEHSAVLRERICAALGWLGIDIDVGANADHAPVVSSASSAVTVVVEPTNEAWIAARAALGVLRANRDA